jgi:acyl-CoA synthetase (AMP-forming)/AMP-acid ligase II
MHALSNRLAQLRSAGRLAHVDGRSLGIIALEKTAENPDRVLVVDGARSVTRGEMLDLACRLGGALASRGVGHGAAIGFQLPNWWEACVINLAATLFGYRLIPLLTIYREAELGHILPTCEIEALFIPESFRGVDFAQLIGRLSYQPKHLFTVRSSRIGETNSFEEMVKSAPAEAKPADADDIKMVLFTSGSTGTPKGVMHCHGTVDALIRRTADYWRIGPDDRLYIPSPIGHIGGSIYAFEFPWITDCTALLAESWNPDEAVRAIDEMGGTFMAGATPFLSGLIASAEKAGTRLASLRRYICGGASVPPELVLRGLECFENAIVSRAYGSTEVPLVCPGVRDREEAAVRAVTDGEIACELKLLGDSGEPVAEGDSGEIAVRGPQMMLGYLNPEHEQGSYTEDGFFLMGDLGRRIDGRYLEITGRKKDIIIRKGENISPLEIENALARHPSVRQVSVVGIPDRERGEMVVAFVLPVEGRSFGFEDMTGHLASLGLARQKFPERLHVVAELPVNSIGKIQKSELKALAVGLAGGGK